MALKRSVKNDLAEYHYMCLPIESNIKILNNNEPKISDVKCAA